MALDHTLAKGRRRRQLDREEDIYFRLRNGVSQPLPGNNKERRTLVKLLGKSACRLPQTPYGSREDGAKPSDLETQALCQRCRRPKWVPVSCAVLLFYWNCFLSNKISDKLPLYIIAFPLSYKSMLNQDHYQTMPIFNSGIIILKRKLKHS